MIPNVMAALQKLSMTRTSADEMKTVKAWCKDGFVRDATAATMEQVHGVDFLVTRDSSRWPPRRFDFARTWVVGCNESPTQGAFSSLVGQGHPSLAGANWFVDTNCHGRGGQSHRQLVVHGSLVRG